MAAGRRIDILRSLHPGTACPTEMSYSPDPNRYANSALYRRCGRSGLKLPRLSLGLWQNFGELHPYENARSVALRAFDLGITHFDLANNYGPPPGAAERTMGRILREDLAAHRDELIISTKAGYDMWPGPYGDFGSRKYLLASLDQSLQRLGLEYVDIFYHHRWDPETPLEETMGALDHAVRSGKALYAGISNYDANQAFRAIQLLQKMGTPLLIHQPKYNMFERVCEDRLLSLLGREGVGCIPFSPLAQGLLTSRYLQGVPGDARAARQTQLAGDLTPGRLQQIQALAALATARGQTLAQMALTWVLRDPAVTSAIIGASRVAQLEENLQVINQSALSPVELSAIEKILVAA
jgi:L-glyceraldehyde 3-phosphate reductase